MDIQYLVNKEITVDEFIDVLNRSTLGERRPVDDPECMKGMLEHADLTLTAWDREKLVGVARSVMDFHYACYLSDLAVDTAYQRQGIGKYLINMTQEQLGPKCKLILISAPAANEYYPKIGFEHQPRTWVLPRDSAIQT
ncbi:MAG: GNAT family N-acetyltransferase [Bacteroidota bacterium]